MTEVPGWYQDFVAAVVSALPNDIDDQAAIGWVKDPAALQKALAHLGSDAPATSGPPGAVSTDGAFKNDKTGDGWQMLSDVTEPAKITAETMKLSVLDESDDFIIGEEAVARVEAFEGLLGQRHVEYLLDHPQEIPEEFQKFSLVFAGTVWLSTGGGHQVPCISYRKGTWEFTFGLLEGGLDSGDRLVVVA